MRNTCKYRLKQGGKTVYYGITYDLERCEAEHQKDYPGSRIEQVGHRTTREEALKWQHKMEKRKSKEAFINSVVTDQGTGGSWCSNCEYPLDSCLRKWTQEIIDNTGQQTEVWSEGFYKCPNCGAKLK